MSNKPMFHILMMLVVFSMTLLNQLGTPEKALLTALFGMLCYQLSYWTPGGKYSNDKENE